MQWTIHPSGHGCYGKAADVVGLVRIVGIVGGFGPDKSDQKSSAIQSNPRNQHRIDNPMVLGTSSKALQKLTDR